ncbi:MAG: alpha/beta hydrolase [Oscillospiraceae bacterium]|nr:alpha/beta hydrolase [Oscillospiraceae bacterium]
MVQPQNIPREKFPESPSFSEGMITISPRCDNHEMNYIRDIKYIERAEAELYIQLLLPDDITKRTPLLIYVTGSAFHWQNIPQTIPRLCHLVNKGIAVASVQYRGSDAAPFPAQALDVKAAVRFMRSQTDKYGIDPDNLFLMGDSSGGHTALMAGLTAGIPEFEEDYLSEYSSQVRGIIDFYGPTDITRMNDELSSQDHILPDSPEGYLIGQKNVHENPQLAEPTIIMNYISSEREIPPILIFHGTNDELVPFGQSCMLYDKLKEQGKSAVFYAMKGSHHGGREFWSTQVLDMVSDFIFNNSVK